GAALAQHAGRRPPGDLRNVIEVRDPLGHVSTPADVARGVARDRLEAPAPHLAALAERAGAVAAVRRDLRRIQEELRRADAHLDGRRAAVHPLADAALAAVVVAIAVVAELPLLVAAPAPDLAVRAARAGVVLTERE